MQINVTFDQNISTLPTGFVSAVNYVVNYFDNLFTNNCTINICVGYGEVDGNALASNALGESMTSYVNTNYTSLRNALLAENAPGSSTLPSTSLLAGVPFVPQAELKALGLNSSTTVDGYVGFSKTVSWDYTTAAPSAGQYYFIGTFEHEITEVMGRQSLINYAPSFYTAMDLFRYSAPGVRSVAAGGSGSTTYFSVDNGVNNLGTWNNNPNNGDLGDWYGSPHPSGGANDAANDYSSSGVINSFSATDITLMQALGWTVNTGTAAPTIASFSPDSGTVGDGITNATVLTLAGTAVANSTVNVYDGATLVGTVTADGSGNWSLPTGTLSNGPHSFTATDTVSGTTSAASAALNVTVDTVAPTGGTPALTVASDSGTSHSDNLTNVTSPTFTVALNSTVVAGDIVQLLLGGSALAHNVTHTITAADVTAGSVSLAVTAGDLGADGAKSISAKFTDAAGNSSTTAADVITLDTTAPSETISSTIGTDTGSTTTISSGGLTKDNMLALSGTVSDTNGVTSVHVFDGATDLGAATIVGGNWSFTTLALADGTHSLTAKAVDTAGNTTTTAAVTATVDTTAPSETISSTIGTNTGSTNTITSGGLTKDNTLALSGTVSDANGVTSVHVFDGATDLGAATIVGGNWSFTTLALTDGTHSLTVKAIDTAGNTTTTAAVTATVDTTAPSETISTTIGTNTGSTTTITSGGLTKDNTLALSGTVSDVNGVTSVHVFDGATDLGAATIVGGNWSFTTLALTDGTHSLTAKAVDTAGNTTTTAAVTATVDTTAPSETISTTIGTNTGSTTTITSGGLTKDNTLALSGTVSDVNGVTSVHVFDGATDLGAATIVGGNWNFTTLGLTDGTHSLTAKAVDTAGNSTTTAAVTATVDTTAPSETISTTIGTNTGSTTTITSGGLTKDNTLALSGTVSDVNGVMSVHVFDGATDLGAATIVGGNWNFTTLGLTDGTHSLTAKATDAAGNTTTTAAVTATVDTTAPSETISSTIGTDTGSTTTITSGGLTKDNTLALSGTVSDVNGVTSVQIYDGATLLGAATVSAGTWSYTTAALADGSHSLTAKAVDTAGNTTTTAAVTATVDTTAPSETISSTIGTNTGSTTTITSGGLTKDNTLALSGTVSDVNGVTSVQIYDGATLLGAATVSAGTWSYTTAALADGSHSLTAKAVDTAGNTTTTAAVTATVDTTAPSETISATIGTNTGSTTTITSGGLTKDNTLALSGTVSDVNGVTSVHVFDGATDLGAATIVGGNWNFTTLGLTDGTHSLTAKATDTAGNTTTTAAVTATVDTTAPTGGTPDLVAGSDSGSSSTDNLTNATSPTFTVALNSTVAAGDTIQLLLGGSALAHNVLHTITAADVTAGSVSLSVTAGDLGADGAKSISAKFTDAAGNGSTTSALAVTLDTAGPSETISATIGTDTGSTTTISSGGLTKDNTLALSGTVSDANGVSSVHVFDGATDLGAATIVGGNFNFTTLGLTDGTHSFTVKAIDTAGNTTTTMAVTATVDTTAPMAPVIATDTIANTNEVMFTGTAEANSIVNLFDGTTLLGSATADGNGAWAYTTTPLSDGPHAFTATDTDAAGNTSLVSPSVDPMIGAVTVEAFGSTSLVEAANHFYLDDSTGSGPSLKNGGVDVVAGAYGLWAPIGAEQTATGYEVAWKLTGSDQYLVWNTDSNGNFKSFALSPVSGSSAALQSLETSFHQDLNGDGTIGLSTSTSVTIEAFGSTSLVETANHFYLDDSTGSGPSLKNGGADVVAGAYGLWAPIGAEQTATGYEVAWKLTGSDQYLVWNTDSNGNFKSFALSPVSGTSATLQSLETSFHQDLNGDGTIDLAVSTSVTIETAGSTSLVETANHFYLDDSTGSGPSLKNGGADVVAGAYGLWAPIGAEQTATGYEVAWKLTGADQYLVWNTDSNGNFKSFAINPVSGTSAALQSIENSFHQDLNGDGVITTTVLDGHLGSQTLTAGAGPTTLIGGPNDILNAGAGADMFVFPPNFGSTTVNGFKAGTDALEFSHSTVADVAAALSHTQQVGADVVIAIDPQDTLTLHNVLLANLHPSDFHII